MRHWIQLIASCGIVGTLLAVASAQDRSYESDRLSYQYRQPDAAGLSGARADRYYSRTESAEDQRSGIEDPRSDGLYRNETPEERSQRYARLLEAYRNRARSAEEASRLSHLNQLNPPTQSNHSAQPTAASEAEVKNYYRQLFGERAAQSPTESRLAADQHTATARPAQTTESFRRGGPVGNQTLRAGTRTNDTADAPVDPRTLRDLIHADYTRRGLSEERGRIQPVRASESNTTPFEFVDQADEFGPQRTTAESAADAAPASKKQVTILPSRDKQQPAPQQERLQVQIAANPAFTKIESMPTSPAVTAQWVKRSDINVGQECQCVLVVRNTGKVVAADVAVDALFPESVRLTATQPEAIDNGDRLTWQFDSLAPGEEQVIQVGLIPSVRGQLQTTALVRFTGQASGLFTVEEPLLKVAIHGPSEVMVGDPASQSIVISNAGTGVAANVMIEAVLPPGLEHPRGERLLMEVGTLNPGESRTVRLALAAIGGGQQQLAVEARADGNLSQRAEALVQIIAPSLAVAIDGPAVRYVGRSAEYVVRVTNEGGAASNNVRVVHKLPNGFKFDQADTGGTYDENGRSITWFVGHMEPGQTVDLSCELTATEIGDQIHRAGAISEHGVRSETEMVTSVDGTASLVLDIVDLDDPVEVGIETAYEIRVRNDGTAPAQNVGISCEFPASVELLAAKGPTDFRAENGLMLFQSLDQLSPGKAAIYRVHVRGNGPGNHRFRVRLASDSITEPLIFEELTKFYAD